jgi:hypothetical protein
MLFQALLSPDLRYPNPSQKLREPDHPHDRRDQHMPG